MIIPSNPYKPVMKDKIICPECDGVGKAVVEVKKNDVANCPECEGKGYIDNTKQT